jgi:amino acid adenylation domain-containing protein
MSDLSQQIANLPPEMLDLLLRRLDQRTRLPADLPHPLPRRATSQAFPLSFAQERLWFLNQLEPANPAYNIPVAVRLTGPLQLEQFERSLNQLVRRHETLRTTFALQAGQPVQLIAPASPVQMPQHSLESLPQTQQLAQLQLLAGAEAQQPFDLAQGPLLRVRLLRLQPQDHVVLLTLHHIITDGWSMALLLRELMTFYAAFVQAQPVPLAELPFQYADFAIWQREWLRGELLQAQVAYWKEQLAGAPALLALPTDRPRPTAQTFLGAKLLFRVPSALTEELVALGQGERATLFMTLLAAWKLLLYRYSGQSDIVVGTPIANRTRAELEHLIGFFVNTLVLRSQLKANLAFGELLGRVREVCLGAYAHQDVPFEKLVEELQPSRSLSHQPLFQVMFALQNLSFPAEGLAELRVQPLEVESKTAKFDLMLELFESPHGLHGSLEYSSDLFDATTIQRLAQHFQVALAGMVADQAQRLADVSLLTATERHQLLLEWNDTLRGLGGQGSGLRGEIPDTWCVHQLFEAQVERTPDAVALVFDDRPTYAHDKSCPYDHRPTTTSQHSAFGVRQLTYHELNRRANQLAHYLRSLGLAPEARVGVCLPRSPELLLALLGALKAGAAYLPLDPALPPERLRFMLEDAQAPILLTQTALDHGPWTRDDTAQTDTAILYPLSSILYLDADWPQIARQPELPLDSRLSPDNLAYVIYTSGSTGSPKGVLGSHRGLLNRFGWMWTTYPFTPDDVCCHKTALSFVDSLWELLGGLLQGVRLLIIPDDTLREPQRFVRTLADTCVTRIVLVPALLRLLLDTHPHLSQHLPRLRYWLSSGEALSPELCRRFYQHLPQQLLLNLYGASEVAADASCYDTRSAAASQAVLIGRPLPNTQIYLLDPALRPVPLGVVGELYIGGVQLARGYLNRPELSAERFLPNPFANCKLQIADCRLDDPSICNLQSAIYNRLYRTGDLARYAADGSIEFVGRADHQVKLRGFRIELGEIEAALLEHAGVAQAVVVMHTDSSGAGGAAEQRLLAYVVPTSDQRPATSEESASSSLVLGPSSLVSELRRFLQARLPAYMLPAAFVVLEGLPLTRSGKLERRALPAPQGQRPELASAFVAPRSELECTIAAVWQAVLQLEQVSIDDNFFELGGHSLLLVQVQSRLQASLQRELSMVELFRHPSIHLLAKHLEQEARGLGRAEQDRLAEKLQAGKERLAQQRQQRQRALKASGESNG